MECGCGDIIPEEHFRIVPPGEYLPGCMPFDALWDGVELVLCLTGSAVLSIDGVRYGLEGGTLAAMMPFQGAELSPGEGFTMLGLAFTFDFLTDFPFTLKPCVVERIAAGPLLSLTRPQRKLLAEYHALILRQYRDREHPSRAEVVKALVFAFLAEVGHIYTGQRTASACSHREAIVHDFFGLLHAFHRSCREPAFYAGKLCLTTKYLSRVLKEVTGRAIYAWISDFVVKDAKRLLRTTDLTVEEISERLRFPNASFFGRYFKKNTGMTPLGFRKAFRPGGRG